MYILGLEFSFIISLAFSFVLGGTILAYIFFPLDKILSGVHEHYQSTGHFSWILGVERFFEQHPRVRNRLICVQRYTFQYVIGLCTIPLIYLPLYFAWNSFVIWTVMLYFLLLFVIKCCYLPKFIRNVRSLNQIKTNVE